MRRGAGSGKQGPVDQHGAAGMIEKIAPVRRSALDLFYGVDAFLAQRSETGIRTRTIVQLGLSEGAAFQPLEKKAMLIQ